MLTLRRLLAAPSLGALLLLAAGAAPLAAQNDDPWIGRRFMYKSGAKFMLPAGEVPFSKITVPFTVSKVNGRWLWMGRAWIEKQHVVPLEDAPAYYTDYLRNNPASSWAYISRGTAWEAKGELDNAIKDYTEAIRLDPKDAWAYYNRGIAWRAKGEPANAIRDYTEAIRLDPKHHWSYNGRAWLRATCGEARYRNGSQAVADATMACELTDWQNIGYLDTLAAAYAESGDFDKAVQWQTKATDAAPDDEKDDYRSRLELYRAGRPYRQ